MTTIPDEVFKKISARSVVAGKCDNPECRLLHLEFRNREELTIALWAVDHEELERFYRSCLEALQDTAN